MTQQFTVSEISNKARKAIRELGGKVNTRGMVTFPEGTQVENEQVRHPEGEVMIERRAYTIPGGSIIVYHPVYGLYVSKFTGVYGG